MDRKKSGAGSGAAFYATLAVCLLAMGVGSFQLLRRTELRGGGGEPPQISAVGRLPEGTGEASEALSPSFGEAAGSGSESDIEFGGAADPSHGILDTAGTSGNSDVSGTSGGSGTSGNSSGSGTSGNSGTSGSSGNSSASASPSGGTASVKSGGSRNTSGAEASRSASAAVAMPMTGNGSASDKGDTVSGGSAASGGAEPLSDTGTDGSPESLGEASARLVVLRPLEGEVVTAFSVDRLLFNETMGDWRTHDGMDIAAAEGTPVLAACDGTVMSISEDPLMGNTVVLSHDGGYLTTYASLMETAALEAGDHVAAGTPLGAVGSTAAAEASQGPHLHFAVRRDGEAVDPDVFLHGDLAISAANVEPMEHTD